MPDETHETNEATRAEEPRHDDELQPAGPAAGSPTHPATVRRLGGCVEIETR